MAGEKTASFSVRVLAESNARATAGDLETLKASIASSTETAKLLTAGMRSLKGSSEEVITTKNALKAALEAERASISAASLAIMAHGTSYESLVAKEQSALKAKKALDDEMKKTSAAEAKKTLDDIKKSQDELKKSQDELKTKTDGMKQAWSSAGGPLGELQGKYEKLTDIITKTGPATAIAVLGIAAVTAAVVAMSAALVEGTTSLAKFILESGNLQRARLIQLEATSGNTENARAWKNEIDDLARHIATPREALNALANDTNQAFVRTRISGQGIIDSYEAIAKESEAMGKTAGARSSRSLSRARTGGEGAEPSRPHGQGARDSVSRRREVPRKKPQHRTRRGAASALDGRRKARRPRESRARRDRKALRRSEREKAPRSERHHQPDARVVYGAHRKRQS